MASREVGAKGRVVGVDLTVVEPLDLDNTVVLVGDVCDTDVVAAVLEEADGPADVLLSDAAPKLTGVRATDRAREEVLLEAIEALLPRLLMPGGGLLLKLLESPEAQATTKRLKGRFAKAKIVVPEATRKGSSERYLLATGFNG